MKYRCMFILAIFIVLIALSIAMQTGALAVTRSGNVVTLSDEESKRCGDNCFLISQATIEAEVQRRVRQMLESDGKCRNFF